MRAVPLTNQKTTAFEAQLQGILRVHQTVDQATTEHELAVGKLAYALALAVGLKREDAEMIETAACVHDIGKIAVPPAILHKNTPLSAEEFALIKEHSVVGAKLLNIGNHPTLKMAHDIALQHHECFDGTGYPFGAKGDEISFAARITALCDVYDALRAPRSYKARKSHDEVLQIITQGDGRVVPTMFDPRVLDAFRRNHRTLEAIYDGMNRIDANAGRD